MFTFAALCEQLKPCDEIEATVKRIKKIYDNYLQLNCLFLEPVIQKHRY